MKEKWILKFILNSLNLCNILCPCSTLQLLFIIAQSTLLRWHFLEMKKQNENESWHKNLIRNFLK